MKILYLLCVAVGGVLLYVLVQKKKRQAKTTSKASFPPTISPEQSRPITKKEIYDPDKEFTPKILPADTNFDRPEIGAKNKWLYPTDSLGKMERGVVQKEKDAEE